MTNKISDKDKKDWENFLSKNESLPNKDSQSLSFKKYGSIVCDLHGYSLDNANKKIKDLIKNSYEKNLRKLIMLASKVYIVLRRPDVPSGIRTSKLKNRLSLSSK